jgi:hypothetical protein
LVINKLNEESGFWEGRGMRVGEMCSRLIKIVVCVYLGIL